MNFSRRDAVTYLVLGFVFLAIAGVIAVLCSQYALPELQKYFEDNFNMCVMIMVTAIIPCFLVKAFYTYACMKLRVFVLSMRFGVVDGLLPILSDIKLNQMYLGLVTDAYLEDEDGNPIEGISGIKRGLISHLGHINLSLCFLFFADLIGLAIYFITQGTFNEFTTPQIAWMVSLLLIYNANIFTRSFMLAIAYKSMEEWIVSVNPVSFIVAPLVIPIIGFLYLVAVFLGATVLHQSIQQPFFNIISVFGTPMFCPIISAVQGKIAVDDSKRTIDELRRQRGKAPQIW